MRWTKPGECVSDCGFDNVGHFGECKVPASPPPSEPKVSDVHVAVGPEAIDDVLAQAEADGVLSGQPGGPKVSGEPVCESCFRGGTYTDRWSWTGQFAEPCSRCKEPTHGRIAAETESPDAMGIALREWRALSEDDRRVVLSVLHGYDKGANVLRALAPSEEMS